MSIFEHKAYNAHESVHFFQDKETGLKAIIAIHSTQLGLSAGGCRFWSYSESDQAVHDVLRLSKGMSYKSAMAGLALGGGKSVILKPSGPFDREALFEAFGRCVESLKGRYVTAEDVGVSIEDMAIVKRSTDYVAGLGQGRAASGDPSPVTAKGVFYGIRASVKQALGRESLEGVRIAVQGVGHVGQSLCQYLSEAGADLVLTDINSEHLRSVAERYGARYVSVDRIYDQDVDVFSPCALGAVINSETLPRIKAKVIAGSANNQLSRPEMGQILHQKSILYAPDYIINAGGIINIYGEITGDYQTDWVEHKVKKIPETLQEVFQKSDCEDLPTNLVANHLAQQKLKTSEIRNKPYGAV